MAFYVVLIIGGHLIVYPEHAICSEFADSNVRLFRCQNNMPTCCSGINLFGCMRIRLALNGCINFIPDKLLMREFDSHNSLKIYNKQSTVIATCVFYFDKGCDQVQKSFVRYFYLSNTNKFVNVIEDYQRVCISSILLNGNVLNELRRPATNAEIEKYSLVFLGRAITFYDDIIQIKLHKVLRQRERSDSY